MEVGAVKQAFNNEVIQLKKNLNQAKIQVIHKLTRKAKTLTEKKAPDHLKEKNKRKAESAVKEVLLMKKLKPRDIARFIITYKGDLNSQLNKPIVDNDKACARLLLNKSLQHKYNIIKDKFGDVPIKDLLMSRQERRKLKKEAKEAQKNKKKGGKVVNSQGDWNVEAVDDSKDKSDDSDDESQGNDNDQEISDDNKNNVMRQVVNGSEESSVGEPESQDDESEDGNDIGQISDDDEDDVMRQVVNGSDESSVGEPENDVGSDEDMEDEFSDNGPDSDDNQGKDIGKILKLKPAKEFKPLVTKSDSDDEKMDEDDNEDQDSGKDLEMVKAKQLKPTKKPNFAPKPEPIITYIEEVLSKIKPKKKPDKKVKDNRNKNLNEKMLNRKFKKDNDDSQNATKVVDPFFKTATGENYMSVAEPRQPDEVKEVHRQGNRQERRAVMFGRAPRRENRSFKSDKFNRNGDQSNYSNDRRGKFNDSFKSRDSNFNDSKFDGRNSKFSDRNSKFNDTNSKFNDRNKFNGKSKFNDRNTSFNNNNEPKEEKLHPSWEAKKKQSGILPFKGKKIVFDEN